MADENKPQNELRSARRRELLKMSPLLLAGGLLVPHVRKQLLEAGLGFSDRASSALFNRHGKLTFSDAEVVPFSKFPYNYFNVLDPEVDLEQWTLTVEGDVARPGEYKLSQIMALPKVSQNTRHVCVEGWDVIGNFGGARMGDFLRAVGASPSARFVEVECSDDYYESIRVHFIRSLCSVTRCTASLWIEDTALHCGCRCRRSWDTNRRNTWRHFV
jgi:DMSO/TMAO reductase YedYZ molybdopterin-dependent catalytic subunit